MRDKRNNFSESEKRRAKEALTACPGFRDEAKAMFLYGKFSHIFNIDLPSAVTLVKVVNSL